MRVLCRLCCCSAVQQQLVTAAALRLLCSLFAIAPSLLCGCSAALWLVYSVAALLLPAYVTHPDTACVSVSLVPRNKMAMVGLATLNRSSNM